MPAESIGHPPPSALAEDEDAPDDDAVDEADADEAQQTDPAGSASGEDEVGDDGEADEASHYDLHDPDTCPALFGDAETRDYNRRVREAKLTWLESRGDVVEITHTTHWKRPFYLELAGVELLDTEVDERGRWSAVVQVEEPIGDCAPGQYPVGDDYALGKQARVVGVVDGAMLVDFEGDLAYLLTEDAHAPTWQMVWRSGWYFIRRREVSATKASSRARRNRNTRNRNRNRSRRTRRARRR